jgi:hypothetical protein
MNRKRLGSCPSSENDPVAAKENLLSRARKTAFSENDTLPIEAFRHSAKTQKTPKTRAKQALPFAAWPNQINATD